MELCSLFNSLEAERRYGMNKKTIVVLFGGQSSEHEVSRTSASMIISHMDNEKYFILPVGITKEGQWLIYNGPVENIKSGEWEKYGTPAILSPDATQKSLLKIVGGKVKQIPVDVVFPVLHGAWGEDGTIQGLLELAQIPYVGCGVLSSSVSMDKVFTKIIAKNYNITQAKYIWFEKDELKKKKTILKRIEKKLGFPCFVKPANSGSSVGTGKAKNMQELEECLELAFKYDKKVIVEEFIEGREVECAVLGNGKAKASGVGEILAGAEFYDYDAKYNSTESRTVIPADLPPSVVAEIQKTALKIFKVVEGEGLARVDFFVQKGNDRVIFNEINTMPGFTTISMYPMLWEQEGLSKTALIDELIELALAKEKGIQA